MPVSELLASLTDIQLSEGIRANRALLESKDRLRRALAREILTALHAEAGRRVAAEYKTRHYH